MEHLLKGIRVRAEWLEARPLGTCSLAGVQPKVAATQRIFEGVVTHIRGDHPVAPTSVGVWIMLDDGSEVTVDARHIVAVVKWRSPLMSCPHDNLRHCPLYRAAHEPGAAGCDDGQLAGGGCAVDRGTSYAGQVAALRVTHPRIVADAEWAADKDRLAA